MSMEVTGNINWAFGDGGDVEDLGDAAARYRYEQCEDGKWRESCLTCKGLHYERAREFNAGQVCDLCNGLGYYTGEGFSEFDDDEMWQYIWDARSDPED